MSSRTVSVVLTAQVQNYLTNMKAAEMRTLEVERASRSATQQFQKHNEALHTVGVGFLAVGATAAAGLALAVKAASDFGAKMAQLQSLSHANAATMRQAADAAMSVGTAYGFSATQVADAQIELQKAGIGVQQQLGGALKGALTLAAAGQLDLGRATEITTVAMTQFGLSAKDVPHLADLLSAGADKALGSVGDLGEALGNGGLQAHNMGLSVGDTIGTLSAFANVGILGAEAGTQLRSMFLRLQNPTAASKKVLDEYGISINDASGKFVGITKFAGELHDQLGKLDPATRNAALATVFGSHAIVGATALYQAGSKGIGDWIGKVNESGFAAAQAAGKMNSLQGDTQKLAAVFQTDLIKGGSGANDALRHLVQTGTNVLDTLGAIPAPIQTVAVTATALAAGVGLVGGAFLIAVPKIVAFRAAMTELNVSARGTAGAIGKGSALLLGITAVTSGLGAMGQQGTATAQQITLASQTMAHGWGSVGKLFQSGSDFSRGIMGVSTAGDALKASFSSDWAQNLAAPTKFIDGITLGLTHFSDVYKTNEGQFAAIGEQFAGLSRTNYSATTTSFNALVQKLGGGAEVTKELLSAMPAYRDALVGIAGKAHIAATDQNLLALATGKGAVGQRAAAQAAKEGAAAAAQQASTLAGLAGQASSATTDIGALQNAIEGFGSAQLDARSATRAMYQAIDDATAAVKKNGAGLNVHTQAGRDNQAALDGIATAADNAASKTLKQTGDTTKAAAVMKIGRDAYIRAAVAMGWGADAAKRLADRIGLVPGNVKVAVHTTGFDDAQAALKALKGVIGTVPAYLVIHPQVAPLQPGQAPASIAAPKKAGGGAIDGPGQKGVDSVPAILAPGEHVLTAREVDAMGGQGSVYAFRRNLTAGVQAYAAGGAIGDAQHARDAAGRDVIRYTDQRDHAKRALDAANHAATRADKAVTDAADAAAKISGKGSAERKHAAEMHARALRKEAADAKDRVSRETKLVDSLSAKVDKARQANDDARATQTTLQQGSEDFVSTQRRATPTSPIDPLSYVDELRSMSRDSNYSSGRRKAFDKAANGAEASLVKLQTSSAAAATKLTDLKTSSLQMMQSVAQAISGGFTLSGAASKLTTSGWMMRDGMRFQTTTSGPTASSIAGYYQAGKGSALQFASTLKQLAGRGLNAQLLAELAGMGTDQGLPIAQAIMSGSDSDLQSTNDGYAGIAAAGGAAGSTVADANYAAQIAAADANAQQITDEIAKQGEGLRKIIATAFGLKGYAVGTRSATPGLHWVGEHGPELAGFAGGETVMTAGDSRRWVRGGSGGGGAPQITVQAAAAKFPDTITVQDLQGFRATMRVIATQEIAKDAAHDAVLMMGGAA